MRDIREICNLSDEELAARREELRRELRPHVRRRRVLTDGVALVFPPESRSALEDFVAFERGCCPGLDFALREEGGELHVEIHGLDPAASVFLEGVPAGETPVERSAGSVRAGVLGAAGGVGLLCAVPLAATALAGARWAAPLGALEHPAVLALGALVAGLGAWRWQRHRARRVRPAAGGCGC